MVGLIRVTLFTSILFALFIFLSVQRVDAGQHSGPVEIENNIKKLQETNNCAQCDLSGADLTRIDLSGANLEGANLAGAKMFLTNLSGANLKNCDLRRAMFGGADLGNADLSGADLTGASLAGAYMGGTILDGEMLTTTPSKDDDITPIEETVYVEDTVKPKTLQETKDINIDSRHDFAEVPPPVPLEVVQLEGSPDPNEGIAEEEVKTTVPEGSRELPASKTVPVIQKVTVQEKEAEPQSILVDDTKKKLSQNNTAQVIAEKVDIEIVPPHEVVEVASETPEKSDGAQSGHPIVPTQTEEVALVQTEMVEEKPMEVTPGDPIAEEVEEALITASTNETSEEADQDVEDAKEAQGNSSVVEPAPEILKNIEELLDTNRCYGCNLSGADLSGANLDGADLEGADLSNALLKKSDLEDANLKGANLSGADLTGADLSKADLYRAILTGADMTDTILEETLLDDADLSGVKGVKENLLLMESH